MSLLVEGMAKRFGAVAAVQGIDLQVKPGEFFTLLGPSGCGKTTILRVIAGIYPADAGRIVLNGRDLTRAPLHTRNMALMFQNYALFPHLTAAGNVAFGLRMRGTGRAELKRRVDEALALVKLDGLGGRYPAQLSGGQQQRVALARALVIHPDLLLLDEPLSNLDARLRDEMRGEIRDLQQRLGLATVLVTHDIQEAFAMSDRIAVLRAGRIEQVGAPAEIYRWPATRFVANFVGPTNELPGPDGKVLIVRPENIRLGARQDEDSWTQGTVVDLVYLGSQTQVRLRTRNAALTAIGPSAAMAGLRKGDATGLGWYAADGVLLDG